MARHSVTGILGWALGLDGRRQKQSDDGHVKDTELRSINVASADRLQFLVSEGNIRNHIRSAMRTKVP